MARILVIDDSPSAVHKVKNVLEQDDHEVEGLDLIIHLAQVTKEEPPDLIVLDLSMPALSGVNVASFVRLWEREPIPIVVYSSQPREDLVKAAEKIGAAGYVHKSDSDDILRNTVRMALGIGPE